MTLKELIEFLEQHDPATVVPFGFHDPHSYRGNYYELAFQPKENTTVDEMLACAKSAMGNIYGGYKGGFYAMDEGTPVWLAEYGCCGVRIDQMLMNRMVGEVV